MYTCILPNIYVHGERKLLIKTLHKEAGMHEHVLPQSVMQHHADVVLSSFPRLLKDPAASRVMLFLVCVHNTVSRLYDCTCYHF